MEKLKQKLSSRKLWAAIGAVVLTMVTALFGENLTPEMVEALRVAVGGLIAYIFGEGAVDIARIIATAIQAATTVYAPPTEEEKTVEIEGFAGGTEDETKTDEE